MIDVKLLANQRKLEYLQSYNPDLNNPERYNAFKRVFGEENFGIVLAGDLKREIITGEKVPVYLLDKDLHPIKSTDTGVGSKVFLASSFKSGDPFPKKADLEFILDYLEKQKNKGVIKTLVNSKRGSLFEDKLSTLELKSHGISTIPTYHFTTFKEIEKFMQTNPEKYLLKPRFGEEGREILRVNSRNIQSLNNFSLEDYILQEEIDIEAENRMIFYDGEFLGARTIVDRTRPWEIGISNFRKHQMEVYNPTLLEIADSQKILQISDTTMGCIDWAYTKDGNRFYLELNGVGTGLGGYPGAPYNLNGIVANKLKQEYSS